MTRDQAAIWEHFQGEGLESFKGSLPRLSFLARHFRKGDRVLNIGVGGGYFEEHAATRGVIPYSLDPDHFAIERMKKTLSMGERAKQGWSQDIPFDSEFFDGVVMSEVLEHLDRDVYEQTLKQVSRVLKHGAVFLGTVPAEENLESDQVVCPGCKLKFHRWGHMQSFSTERLREDLATHFDDVQVMKRVFPDWSALNWKGKVQAGVKQVLMHFGIHGARELFLFKGRKGAR